MPRIALMGDALIERDKRLREYKKTYYQSHKEHLDEQINQWVKEHPDKVREYKKEYMKRYRAKKKLIKSGIDTNLTTESGKRIELKTIPGIEDDNSDSAKRL